MLSKKAERIRVWIIRNDYVICEKITIKHRQRLQKCLALRKQCMPAMSVEQVNCQFVIS